MEAQEVIEITGLPIEIWSFEIQYDHWVQVVGPKNWVAFPIWVVPAKEAPGALFEKLRCSGSHQ